MIVYKNAATITNKAASQCSQSESHAKDNQTCDLDEIWAMQKMIMSGVVL
jgi:hypothetical protein